MSATACRRPPARILFLLLAGAGWGSASAAAERLPGAGQSSTPVSTVILIFIVMGTVVVVGTAAVTAVIKRYKVLRNPEAERAEAVAALPSEVIRSVAAEAASPSSDPVERHRHAVAIENRAREEACRIAAALSAAGGGAGRQGPVWLVAGSGPLGAVAFATARHLDALGLQATAQSLVYPDKLGADAARERKTLLACKLRVSDSPAARPPKDATRVVFGADPELLSDPRRGDLDALRAAARAARITVEDLETFSAAYVPPPPAPDGLVIPVPEEPLSREDVRLLDSLAQQHYGLSGAALMENAGFWAAREAYLFAQGLSEKAGGGTPRIAVVCGKGNNGGDGFVVARHLRQWGLLPEVFLLGLKDNVSEDAGRNLALLQADGFSVQAFFDETQLARLEEVLAETDLIVDAILGTGMTGEVRGMPAAAIRLVNAAHRAGAWVLALDCPSGIDCNTGAPLGECVQADLTVTFAANKIGFLKGQGPELCGKVVLADIGLPREIYRRRLG